MDASPSSAAVPHMARAGDMLALAAHSSRRDLPRTAVASTVDTVAPPVAASAASPKVAKPQRSESQGAAVPAATRGPSGSLVSSVVAVVGKSRGWVSRTGHNMVAVAGYTAHSISTC